MGLRLACPEHATRTQDAVVHWLTHEVAAYLKDSGGGVIADFVTARIVFMVATFDVHPGVEIFLVTEGDLIAIVTLVQEHALRGKVVT